MYSPNNELLDFSDLNIVPAEQGGNLVEAYFEARKASVAAIGKKVARNFDRSVWDPPVFYEGITDEDLYGGLAIVVGHEITHGFDDGGVRYNKDGSERPWMPEEDQQAFNDRADKVSAYYSSLYLFSGSGNYGSGAVNKEAIADMGGVRIALKAAEKLPGFNYDAFFRKCDRCGDFSCERRSASARLPEDKRNASAVRKIL